MNKGTGTTGLGVSLAAVLPQCRQLADTGRMPGQDTLMHIDGFDLPPWQPNADMDVFAGLGGQAHTRPKGRRWIPHFPATMAEAVSAARDDELVGRGKLADLRGGEARFR